MCQRLAYTGSAISCSYSRANGGQSRGSIGSANVRAVAVAAAAGPTNSVVTAPPSSAMYSCTHLSIVSQYGWPNPTSEQEKGLLYHLCVLRKQLETFERRGLLAGIIQFSRSLSMAGRFPHLRHSLCSFSASHIGGLTQSSLSRQVELHYRGSAIQGMAADLEILNSGSGLDQSSRQGLVESAIILAWYSNDPGEYAQLLKGTLAVCSLLPENARSGQPALVSPVTGTGLPTCAAPPHHTYYPFLEQMRKSTLALSRCDLSAGVRAAVKDLHNFIYNILHSPLADHSVERELRAMFPIRNWLRFVPEAPSRLESGSDDDFLLHMYLANYETAVLLTSPLWPDLDTPLGFHERRRCVRKMRDCVSERLLKKNGGALLPVPPAADPVVGDRKTLRACREWLCISEIAIECYDVWCSRRS
ncbi:hypothetical protein V2A60_002632 [Cordyceps javanica]